VPDNGSAPQHDMPFEAVPESELRLGYCKEVLISLISQLSPASNLSQVTVKRLSSWDEDLRKAFAILEELGKDDSYNYLGKGLHTNLSNAIASLQAGMGQLGLYESHTSQSTDDLPPRRLLQDAIEGCHQCAQHLQAFMELFEEDEA
jgi:hypothetical protein